MQDSERLTRGPLDYEVLIAFLDPGSHAQMRVGDKISLDENIGSLLCRKGYLKDVTARVADTITERVEDLETASAAAVISLATKATSASVTAVEARTTVIELVISDNNLTTSD